MRQYVQLLGRGLVGVRAADGKFLWGYNRVANRVANISDADRAGDFVFASTGYQTGSGARASCSKAGDGVTASEVYFLDATTLQNHHGGMVLVGNHVYAGHGHKQGLPHLRRADHRQGGLGRRHPQRRQRLGGGRLCRRPPLLPLRERPMLLIEATPAGYREKGSFTIPDVQDRAGRTR